MNHEVNGVALGQGRVMVSARDLCFGYPGLELAHQASHEWTAGLHLLQGEEGTGKTGWLKVLAGRFPLRSGELRFTAGQLPAHEIFWQDPRAELDAALRECLVGDWVARQAARYPRWSQATWEEHAQALSLLGHGHKPLLALSAGSLRKLRLAAAWASGAMLTLIDEPLAALDLPSVRHVQQALASFAWRHQAPRVAAGESPRCIIVAHWDRMQGVAWDGVIELT